MSKVEIVNIVKKITELSKRDKVLFTKILGQISEGGGGSSTSDSIKVTPQELTEAQQMQARKNQGLYYEEEGIGDKTTTCDNDNPPEDWKDTAFGMIDAQLMTSTLYVKVSDDVPAANGWKEIISHDVTINSFEVSQGNGYYKLIVDLYPDTPQIIVVQNEGDVAIDNMGTAHEPGIYVASSVETERTTDKNSWYFLSFDVTSITYEALTTLINQIPSKYISDDAKFNTFEIVVDYNEFSSLISLNVDSIELDVNFNDILDACDKGKILILKAVDNDSLTSTKHPVQLIGTNASRIVADDTSPYGTPGFIFNYIKTQYDGQGKPNTYSNCFICLYLGENENYEEVTKLTVKDSD